MLQQVQEFNHFRLATLKDIKYLAPRLRYEDKREILSSAGMLPYYAIYYSYLKSNVVFTIVNKQKEPVGIFGVTVNGAIWLLATDKLKDIQFSFLKEGKKVIDFLNSKYKILWNYVDSRNSLHIKWLKWCGFKFINKKKYGVLNEPFYEVVRICV